MSRKFRRPRARPLRVERLEDRSLLAVAAFTIELREDQGGVPGDILAADEIEVGDCFFVEILAQEFHPLYSGLHGVALNIAWDPTVLEEIDAGFDPNLLVTDALPLFRGGTLDNAAGTIDDLSGSAFHSSGMGHPIGNGTPERFALLHFRAESAAAATSIRMSEGASSIVAMPAATFSSAQLSFEQQTIAIAAPDAPGGPVDPPPADIVTTSEPPLDPPAEEITVEAAPDDNSEPIESDPTVFMLTTFDPPGIGNPDVEIPEEPAGPVDDQVEPPPDAVSTDDVLPPSDPASDTDIYTMSNAGSDTANCTADASFAAAVDLVLMGPLTPEQFAVQSVSSLAPHDLRLQDLIALIAADIAERRREATVLNATPVACS